MNLFVFSLLAYLCGAIPTSILIGKWFFGKDIRDHGSGNAGATNAFRVFGKPTGIIVVVVDMAKGWMPVACFPQWFGQVEGISIELLAVVFGVLAVAGHIWTVFAQFRGGKGVATGAGMMLGLFPGAVLAGLIVFGLILIITRYVSFASILGSVTMPVVLIIQPMLENQKPIPVFVIASALIAALILFTHRGNIRRLIEGTERKVGQSAKPGT